MLPGMMEGGHLSLIMGPMFAGKTSKLAAIYQQYKVAGIPVVFVNHSLDTRYGESAKVSTHSGESFQGIAVGKLWELDMAELGNPRVILVNEAQFFQDVESWTTRMVEDYNKVVVLGGLDGDFRRECFGTWLNLIPIADCVEKLHALCVLCKARTASFSLRLHDGDDVCAVGGANQYAAACRTCYLNRTKTKTV